MVTSEYAMGIVAAVAFAVVLYKVVTSGQVSAELQNIVKGALDARYDGSAASARRACRTRAACPSAMIARRVQCSASSIRCVVSRTVTPPAGR